MSTFERLTNGNVKYTDESGRSYGLSPANNIVPVPNDSNLLEITPALNASSPTSLIIDWRDVTSPTVTSRNNLIDELNTNFFFRVSLQPGQPGGGLTQDQIDLLSHFSLDRQEEEIIIDWSLVVPPNTVYVSENLGIEGAGEAFAVIDRASNRRGYLVAYERGLNNVPFFRQLLEQFTNNPIQPLKDTVSASNTFTSSFVATANRLITTVILESNETVTGANIRVLKGDHIVAEALNIDFTADTLNGITIPPGFFITTGDNVEIQVSGVVLKGTGTGASFQPFFNADWFRFERKMLATEDFVRNLTNPLSISNVSLNIARRVDLNTDLSGSKTVSFNVDNYNLISTIQLVIGANTINLTKPTADGQQSQSVTLPAIDTSTNTTLNFIIRTVDTLGNTTNWPAYTVAVRAALPQEFVYYGRVASTVDPATVDITTLNKFEATAGTKHNFTIPSGNLGDDVLLLVPDNHSIKEFKNVLTDTDVLHLYVRTDNIRQINSINTDSLVLDNLVAGATFQYEITLN